MTATAFIGAAAGFAGDRTDAGGPLVAALARCAGPRFLMFETLAERTLALSQIERRRDPGAGYSPALERFVCPLLADCLRERIAIVGNFGAANPRAAAGRILAMAAALKLPPPRIAVVEGDDIAGEFGAAELAARESDGALLRAAGGADIVAANVYLGAVPIAEGLAQGADIVVTGRVADSALALGPLMHAFGWQAGDWDRLAAGTLAGHLLECGAQITGGYFADPPFKQVPGMADLGYPLAAIGADGDIVVTKPPGSGGRVDRQTVIEQLLYEIHDPAAYLAPDVVLDVTDVTVEDIATDRVRVAGRARPAGAGHAEGDRVRRRGRPGRGGNLLCRSRRRRARAPCGRHGDCAHAAPRPRSADSRRRDRHRERARRQWRRAGMRLAGGGARCPPALCRAVGRCRRGRMPA